MNTLLIFGYGFSSRALAQRLVPLGWRVIGTTRTSEKLDAIRADGVEPVIWPDTDMSAYLKDASHLLISAGPSQEGDPVLNTLESEIAASDFDWVGYLSTTGVYGDHQGDWVDESTPLTPSTKRGKLRVMAEGAWQKLNLPLHIFRLAGIYGPSRGPFSKVRNGTARRIIKQGQVFSRIHVDDIAQVLEASIRNPNPGAIYNVCDDMAAPPQDVIGYAAELLGVPLPETVDYDTADMTPMARSFYAESKRVSNKRITEELGVTLKYPDYKVGLQALLAQEERDGDTSPSQKA